MNKKLLRKIISLAIVLFLILGVITSGIVNYPLCYFLTGEGVGLNCSFVLNPLGYIILTAAIVVPLYILIEKLLEKVIK